MMRLKKPAGKPDEAPPAAATAAEKPTDGGVRETIEQVIVAFILAFLFRTFEAEAFVIPTGSMAPTLMGQHKDLACFRCKFPYRVGDAELRSTTRSGVCPNCGYPMFEGAEDATAADPEAPRVEQSMGRTYRGDRILVTKFPYEFGDPQRWDVAVFRFPVGARDNYIKRVVGLPHEWVVIRNGDIYAAPREGGPLDLNRAEIQSKPSGKIPAMMQTVYDNDYAVAEWIARGLPPRWEAVPADESGAWRPAADYRSFATDGAEADIRWLRYRHRPANEASWEALARGPLGPAEREAIAPRLISDSNAYNSARESHLSDSVHHWVGDLIVEVELEIRGPTGRVHLDLVEGGWAFVATIDVATGEAALAIRDPAGAYLPPDKFGPRAATPIRGAGTYRLRFANVDDHLHLWVNGRVVEFSPSGNFAALRLPNRVPTSADLSPVGVGVEGAAAEARGLRVFRDLYYIADCAALYNYLERTLRLRGEVRSEGQAALRNAASGAAEQQARAALQARYDERRRPLDAAVAPHIPLPYQRQSPTARVVEPLEADETMFLPTTTAMSDYVRDDYSVWMTGQLSESQLAASLDRLKPDDWLRNMRAVSFPLDAGQYLMLGDNSARSSDSRLWDAKEYYVERDLIVGKAVYVYWPHAVVPDWAIELPLGSYSFSVPLVPNVGRMRLIR